MSEQMETVVTESQAKHWHPDHALRVATAASEVVVVDALRRGSEQEFERLVERISPGMLGLARTIVSDRDVAEDVVQETWLSVIRGLDRFEGRSSLKTWIFSILTNVARTRAKRERRTVAFSRVSEVENPADGLTIAAERFSDARYAWMAPSNKRKQTPESRILSQEMVALIRETLRSMPPRQAEVVTLRDIEGWSATETCATLGLSESNQKVLLHRGRTRVRDAIERYRNVKAMELN